MQAIFFFSLFGFVFAILAAFVGNLVLDVVDFQQKQVADTQRYLTQVAQTVDQYTVMAQVRSPVPTPETAIFLLPEVRQHVSWVWGNYDQDPWQEPFQVYTATQDHIIRAAANPGQPVVRVSPQVTAYAFASSGPDLEFQTDFSSVNTSDINSILRLSVPNGSDDIVLTFDTRQAVEERWQKVEAALQTIAQAVASQLEQDYARTDFNLAMQDYFSDALVADAASAASITGFFEESDGSFQVATSCTNIAICIIPQVDTTTGRVTYVKDEACLAAQAAADQCDVFTTAFDDVLGSWKDPDADAVGTGAASVALTQPNLLDYQAIVDGDTSGVAAFLNDAVTGFTLGYVIRAASGGSTDDVVQFRLTTGSGSVWNDSSNAFSYHLEIGDTP